MSLRAFRFAVLSFFVLCAPCVAAEEAHPGKTESGAEAVTPPRLLHAEPALVPEGEAASEAVPVTLALTIDEKGHVTEATIIDSGGERFDESALAAVKSLEFEPARREGIPFAAKIRYRYVFPAPTSPTPDAAPSASPPALAVPTPAAQPEVALPKAHSKTSQRAASRRSFRK